MGFDALEQLVSSYFQRFWANDRFPDKKIDRIIEIRETLWCKKWCVAWSTSQLPLLKPGFLQASVGGGGVLVRQVRQPVEGALLWQSCVSAVWRHVASACAGASWIVGIIVINFLWFGNEEVSKSMLTCSSVRICRFKSAVLSLERCRRGC